MGGYFSKIGSDPYYANYDKSFQRLKTDIDKLKVRASMSGLSRLGARNKASFCTGQATIQATPAEQDRTVHSNLGLGIVCCHCTVCSLGKPYAAWISDQTANQMKFK